MLIIGTFFQYFGTIYKALKTGVIGMVEFEYLFGFGENKKRGNYKDARQ